MDPPAGMPPEDEADALAGELALRVLAPDEERAARARAAADAGFAARVAAWEARFAGLGGEVEDVAPSPAARAALMARAFGAAPARRRIGWLTGLLGGLALAAAAVLALVLTGLLAVPRGGAPLVAAEIASEAPGFRVVATLDREAGLIHLARIEGEAPPGRVLQLWGHAPEDPVRSIGLIPPGDAASLPLPPGLLPASGPFLLGISEEPPGGSLGDAPSGEVLGEARIDAL